MGHWLRDRPRPKKGFPKLLPCLVCDRPRRSTHPGDRIHAGCRRNSAGVADGSVNLGRRGRMENE